MSRTPEEYDTDRLLSQGLRDVPVPEVSADFDARVHAALRRPTPWWQSLWISTRPVLTAAACSLVVTLVLLQGFAGKPTTLSYQSSTVTNTLALERGRAYIDMVDQRMDRMDLSNASWRLFTILWWPIAAKSSPKPEPSSNAITPNHRSQLSVPPAA